MAKQDAHAYLCRAAHLTLDLLVAGHLTPGCTVVNVACGSLRFQRLDDGRTLWYDSTYLGRHRAATSPLEGASHRTIAASARPWPDQLEDVSRDACHHRGTEHVL